jgi:uncharacterized membrane protein YfcA
MVTFGGVQATTTLIAICVMALGSACQAALGTGLALLVVPILALVDPGFIPGPMLLAGSVLAATTAYRDRDAIEPKGLGLALTGLAVGTMVGALVLHYAAGPGVQRLFGVMVLAAVLVSLFGRPVVASARSLILGGAAAGVMGTVVGIHGPPITLVFQNAEPKTARAMLGAFFTVAYLGAVAALALFGLFGGIELVHAVALLPGVALGLALAPVAQRVVNRAVLRVAILGLATVSGLLLVLK